MKKHNITNLGTSINCNESVEGETIEQKIERVVGNNEPITDGAPIVFTERKDGVKPEYDIRTDRFDIAIEAMDKVTKQEVAKRMEGIKARDEAKKGAKPPSIQGTDNAVA